MSDQRAVLAMEDVTVSTGRVLGHATRMRGTLAAHPGDLVLVEVPEMRLGAIWADAAVGLSLPISGRVRLLGVDWGDLDPEAANHLRARVGRVFLPLPNELSSQPAASPCCNAIPNVRRSANSRPGGLR